MTTSNPYQGPERRQAVEYHLPDNFHDRLAELLTEITGAEVAKCVQPLRSELGRLRRVIEGENGGMFNYGITGAIEKVIRTDTDHDKRLLELERKWDRLRWSVAGAALGGGLGGAFLSELIARSLGGG